MSVASEPSTSSSVQLSEQCRHFQLFDILLATENFDESLVIGRGGFGKVYKGTIFNGSANVLAAIKRLDRSSNQGAPEFWAEVEMLSKLRHCNLVSLFGYCNDEEEMVLVYEYMPNGTLEDHLHKLGTQLSWVQRLKICIGAGRGLHYLHTGTGIDVGVIHRDVKTSNILLQESWAAKISDFGLSKIGPTNQTMTHVSTLVRGTFGYFDPDYYATGKLTRKSDVYAFGVVLLEVLCRKRAVFDIDEETFNLAVWAQESIKEGNLKNIIDPDLKGQISSKCLKEFGRITKRCLHSSPKKRSTMAEVLLKLESSILNLQEKFNKSVQPASRTIIHRMINKLPFPSKGENTAEEDFEVRLSQLKRFSLRELQVATDNFSNRHIIGGNVYKGRLADGTLVVVKRLKKERIQFGELQFQTEVEIISLVIHKNLLQLRGFCMTPTEWLRVYPYMANGSVASCLRERHHKQEPLDWPIRKRIALGSARGLAYLHEDCEQKIIHRDVKAANILLDEEFEAVVGDFGLAKLMDKNDTHVTTAVRGTIGHIPPEYLSTGKASPKTDVFGYGVMLLELITGQQAFDLARLANDDDVMLLDWVKGRFREVKLWEWVDADLKGNYIEYEVDQLIQVALLCTQGTPSERPKMSEVVRMLEGDGLAERWKEWQNVELFRQEFNTTSKPSSSSSPCISATKVVNPFSKVGDVVCSDSDKDEVLEPDNPMAKYLASAGGGYELEDYFSDDYVAQVYDLP